MLIHLCLAFACVQGVLTSRKICYDEMLPKFRCYNTSDPFTNTFGILPMSPTEQNITFKLFTQTNKVTPEILVARDEDSVKRSNFIRNDTVAFVIHGFQDSTNEDWVANLTEKLLLRVPNVIAVDWSKGARGGLLRYFQAAANTRVVGAQVATMILTMVNASVGVTENNTHLIGHSLGAHVAGYAGKGLKEYQKTVARITGLDPAGNRFEKFKPPVRLDHGDAEFVDVIHTSTRSLPNDKFCEGRCSHNIVREYFRASINDALFIAQPCNMSSSDEHNFMGYHAYKSTSKVFCLKTGAEYPFGTK